MFTKIQYSDGVTPLMQQIIDDKPKWFQSALKSTGYWAQKEIKAGIRSGAPGGQKYARLMPAFLRRRLEEAFGHDTRRNYKPLGKLVNAVGYDKTKVDRGVVIVGWLSMAAVYIGSKLEKGFFTLVTERLRMIYNMAGIKMLGSTTQITVVARPTYEPMRPIIQAGAPKQMELKMGGYLQGVQERSAARSKRAYIVYQ